MDNHTAANQTRPAPDHQRVKACINCAKVKCKCIPRRNDSSCERCHRLGKVCIPSAGPKQRGPKRGAPSRSARVEEKLNDLVALLRAGTVPSLSKDTVNVIAGYESNEGPESPSASVASTQREYEISVEMPTEEVAEAALARFRVEMMVLIPFVHIPPHTTSSQLRETNPFLWLNIMAVGSRSVRARTALSKEARRIIIEDIVAGGQRTLDLLLGTLTFLNWQFASVVLQLVVCLIWDLGLHAPPSEGHAHLPVFATAATQQQHTIQEKRAALGAFIITSMLSQTFKTPHGFRWSAYLDECLADVSLSSTVAQDRDLVRLVKLQLIVNQVRQSAEMSRSAEVPSGWTDLLQRKLDELAIDPNRADRLGNESTLASFHYFASLVIRESTLSKASSERHQPDPKRFETFEHCMNSIRSWLDIFFSATGHALVTAPCSTFSQLFYAICFLRQMTLVADVSWSPAATQQAIDPMETIDRLILTFEELKAWSSIHGPEGEEEDPALSLGIKKFETLKSGWSRGLTPSACDHHYPSHQTTPLYDYRSSQVGPMHYLSTFLLPDSGEGIPW